MLHVSVPNVRYHPDHKDSVAAFMTNARDAAQPARLDDMYLLMRAEAEGATPACGRKA